MPPANQSTPPSSSSSKGTSSDTQQSRVLRKRNRVLLSCAPCRDRKLKCNRGHPCDNCIRRGDMIYCKYVVPEYRRPMLGGFVDQSPEGMRHRINKLEGLVLSLVADGSSQAEPGALCAATASTQSRQSSTASGLSFGIVSSTTMRQCQDDNQESEAQRMFQHVGTTDVYGGCAVHPSDGHWYAILMEIMDVKNCLSTHQQEYSCRFVDGENLRDNMMGAVEQCVKTWDRVRKQNMEAHKAYVALRVMVKKLKAYRVSQQTALSDPPQRLPPRSATSATLSNRGKSFSIKAHHGSLLEQIAAVVPEIPSSGDKSPNRTFSLASRLGFTAAPQIAGGAHPMLEDTLTDMDGMLHDLMKGERTDLTPQSWDLETSTGESNGSSSSSSQTSDLVEAIGGGIENLVADIDEGAWNSYIQSAGTMALDPQFWQCPSVDDRPLCDSQEQVWHIQ